MAESSALSHGWPTMHIPVNVVIPLHGHTGGYSWCPRNGCRQSRTDGSSEGGNWTTSTIFGEEISSIHVRSLLDKVINRGGCNKNMFHIRWNAAAPGVGLKAYLVPRICLPWTACQPFRQSNKNKEQLTMRLTESATPIRKHWFQTETAVNEQNLYVAGNKDN